jgi:hypothetical protein
VKKKSKRWIKELAVQNEYFIHLFDFFFFSSDYRQAGYYFQAFVSFVSLWFSSLLFLKLTPVGQALPESPIGDNFQPQRHKGHKDQKNSLCPLCLCGSLLL